MLRHEPAAADAKFGVALGGEHAFDQFHARPDAAGILPAAARTAEPFAEDGARQHEPAFVFLERTVQRTGLAGRPHAQRNHRGQQVRGDREPRAFGNAVDGADEFESPARPDDPRQQIREALARAFHAGRNDAAGDDRRLEQAEVIFGEIEHVGQVRDVGGGAEVHAGQAQHRFIHHAQIGFDRRPRGGIAPMHAEVDRDVQHLRALGIIHAEKENVAPAAMRQVHAHRGAFAQDRVGAVARRCAAAVRAGCAADDRRDGPCGTSIDCRAPSARCGAPGRPAFAGPAADRPRPARWKSGRTARPPPAP